MKTVEHKYTWEANLMETTTKLHSPSESGRFKTTCLCERFPIMETSVARADDFDKLLLEAVDGGLASLGSNAKQTIYSHLEREFNITKREIPDRIEEFVTAIEEIFGVGAQLIEIQIMKSLYGKVRRFCRHFPKQDCLVFVEYVDTARSLCQLCSRLDKQA